MVSFNANSLIKVETPMLAELDPSKASAWARDLSKADSITPEECEGIYSGSRTGRQKGLGSDTCI